ncbi:transcriptional repressor [Paenibacillus sp. 598K]|uniref:ferric iron uptake transcriptional regulator n=1 Tax=Paenibacillus sp. 598K TaxID=1117987 RepID=UPI000FFA3396|nr:Fur family transcriptional regulator [Paenibacillus sp. 598K]GBF74485.1 transcriptional repressor [Paenibacillus sp. 598K]
MIPIVEELGKINHQLKMKGYKLTPQREVTVRVLLENEQDHLSAEDVYMLVKQKFPEIGLATVYRTLEMLTELQIVEKVNFGDGVARFDLRSDDHAHMHHHLICRDCGAVQEIKDDWLQSIEERIEREFGFLVSDHRLDFTGVFNKCAKTNKSECRKKRKAV